MKASVFQTHNRTKLKKIPQNPEEIIDSALTTCQEVTLLACNGAVESCAIDSMSLQSVKHLFINSINEINQNIAKLTDSAKDKFEKLETIQSLLKQLQEINTKFHHKDQ